MYKEIEKEIRDKGYEMVLQEYHDRLRQLFKEMLEYKHKQYDDDNTFEELMDMIDTSYYYYHDSLQETLDYLHNDRIYLDNDMEQVKKITEVDRIIKLKELYNIMMDESDNYKKHAYDYREYVLKDGETYDDIYRQLKDKFKVLFYEMLDYVGACYDKTRDDYEYLEAMVVNNYPFYGDKLRLLDSMAWSPDVTYIDILNSMESIYESMTKNYKKREELLREYRNEWNIDWSE